MIPFINFSNIVIPTNEIFNDRIVAKPYPSEYTRVQYSIDDTTALDELIDILCKWLLEHIIGKFGIYRPRLTQEIVLFFEDVNDAVLFKLMDGMEICKKLNENRY